LFGWNTKLYLGREAIETHFLDSLSLLQELLLSCKNRGLEGLDSPAYQTHPDCGYQFGDNWNP
jgi:hypothetical protein